VHFGRAYNNTQYSSLLAGQLQIKGAFTGKVGGVWLEGPAEVTLQGGY
jgi:hypothetical protein